MSGSFELESPLERRGTLSFESFDDFDVFMTEQIRWLQEREAYLADIKRTIEAELPRTIRDEKARCDLIEVERSLRSLYEHLDQSGRITNRALERPDIKVPELTIIDFALESTGEELKQRLAQLRSSRE